MENQNAHLLRAQCNFFYSLWLPGYVHIWIYKPPRCKVCLHNFILWTYLSCSTMCQVRRKRQLGHLVVAHGWHMFVVTPTQPTNQPTNQPASQPASQPTNQLAMMKEGLWNILYIFGSSVGLDAWSKPEVSGRNHIDPANHLVGFLLASAPKDRDLPAIGRGQRGRLKGPRWALRGGGRESLMHTTGRRGLYL